jgi:Peptidase family M23/Abnormal spindle-like microcephaly-assoc'd, ASPM-SPD-2-Hydin
MSDLERGLSTTETVDPATKERWLKLSAQTALENTGPSPCRANHDLEAAAQAEPQSPVAPLYRLWIAENFAREARYSEAVKAYDSAIHSAQSARRFLAEVDVISSSLFHKAQAAALDGDTQIAISAYQELAKLPLQRARALFQAGLIAETERRDGDAAEFYRAAASEQASSLTDVPGELARRALQRMEDPKAVYLPSARALSTVLGEALSSHDTDRLDQLIAKSHFAVAPVGGHTSFEQPELLDRFYRDLLESTVHVRNQLKGSGAKLYLMTSGWDGEWFRGDVMCLLTRAPKGWQWTGMAITQPHDLWIERWRPATRPSNQALPFSLLAPWPAGQSFKAGGLPQFLWEQVAVLAAGWPLGGILAFAFSDNACGFGPRGFYYNEGPTHEGAEAFAIDFTRYRQDVPYDNESGGTPVLAVRGGVVVDLNAAQTSGDPNIANFVTIAHEDPNNPGNITRFHSQYLHFAGPFMIPVFKGMSVITGQRLGLMDDTGNSALDHLHFTIHDTNIPFPNAPLGGSVRPNPIDGVRLGDGDSGTCVMSTNVERTPGLNINPSPLTFGKIFIGGALDRHLTIDNSTGVTINVSISASPAGSPFSWSAFNGSLADGQATSLTVEFEPQAIGFVQRTLTITSTDPGSPHLVRIDGTGTPAK